MFPGLNVSSAINTIHLTLLPPLANLSIVVNLFFVPNHIENHALELQEITIPISNSFTSCSLNLSHSMSLH